MIFYNSRISNSNNNLNKRHKALTISNPEYKQSNNRLEDYLNKIESYVNKNKQNLEN